MFVEFHSFVDGPGMFFAGKKFCPQASHTCCDSFFGTFVFRVFGFSRFFLFFFGYFEFLLVFCVFWVYWFFSGVFFPKDKV